MAKKKQEEKKSIKEQVQAVWESRSTEAYQAASERVQNRFGKGDTGKWFAVDEETVTVNHAFQVQLLNYLNGEKAQEMTRAQMHEMFRESDDLLSKLIEQSQTELPDGDQGWRHNDGVGLFGEFGGDRRIRKITNFLKFVGEGRRVGRVVSTIVGRDEGDDEAKLKLGSLARGGGKRRDAQKAVKEASKEEGQTGS